MTTSVNARACLWLDGVAVAAQDLRLQTTTAHLTSSTTTGTTGIAATQGVRPAVGSPLACVWSSGLSFNLNAGCCFVQGTAAANSGAYELVLDTTTLLTCTAADPSNPRIDSVIAQVTDNGNNTSTAVFRILPGTPAASPVAPTLPANSLLLCNISVAAAASTLAQVNFTDQRVSTVASGGILPVATSSGTQTGPAGAYLDDQTTGRLKRLDGSGNARAPKVGAFAPVSTTVTGSVTIATGGGTTTIGSISITTDGVTEVELIATHEGYQPVTPALGVAVQAYFTVDGTKVGNAQTCVWESSTTLEKGSACIRAFTTPSAGTHTVALVGATYGGTSNVNMVNGSGQAACLIRAQPAVN